MICYIAFLIMTSRLTIQERAKIAARYEVWNSVVEVQRWWRTLKGSRATLRRETIRNCHAKLMTTGSVNDKRRSGRPSTSRSPAKVAKVQEMFDQSPQKSTRQAARESGLSRHSILRVLHKELNYRPWKPHYVQELMPEDCDRRMEYGELMLGWYEDWPELFENILWSDEAVFHVDGFVNRHNCHYWGTNETDPKQTVERMQTRPKVTVCCGMTASRIIGPYVLRDTMNAERYLHMLDSYVWPTVSGWDNIDDLIFMQDGAPPHFALTVRAWLDQHFSGRWLGRRGPHEWPPRSPDLTPCDFYLWGYTKEEVLKTKPRTLEDLEIRIQQVLNAIPNDILLKVVRSIPGRLMKLVEANGAYLEI